MDLKALMQKLETIDKKEILTEAEKKETTWTDKSGKKHPATQVKGDKYTGKEAEKDDKKSKKDDLEEGFTSAIARALVEEFGYELEEAAPVANPYQGADAAKFAAMSPEDQAWLTKGGGKPDINDEIILSRAPNKGKPAAAPATSAATGVGNPGEEAAAQAAADKAAEPTAADRDDAEMGAAMRANAAGGNSTSAATGVGNPGEEAAAQAAAAGGQAASPAAPAEVPAGINPDGGEKYDSVANAPLQLPPGAEPEAGMSVAGGKPAAGGQAASPAKPAAAKPGYKTDPLGQSIANQLKMTTPDAIKTFQKSNGLQADGLIGPATTKALQAAAQKMGLTVASGVGTSTAGGGRGGQGGPTAAQLAQAPAPAGGQAASPAGNPEVAKIDAEIKRFSGANNMSLQANKDYVAKLQSKKAAAAGGTTQTPAQQAVAKDIGSFAGESINYAEDQILLRIKSLAGL